MDFIVSLATKYPYLMTVLSAMGALRLILKPTFSYVHQLLGAVNATKLDAQVTILEKSVAVTWLYYILDWIASVKLAAPSVIVAAPSVVGFHPVVAAATVTQTVTKIEATQAAVDAALSEVKK